MPFWHRSRLPANSLHCVELLSQIQEVNLLKKKKIASLSAAIDVAQVEMEGEPINLNKELRMLQEEVHQLN